MAQNARHEPSKHPAPNMPKHTIPCSLADYLAQHPPPNWAEAEDAYVFPELNAHASPGTALGNFIKALRPRDRGGAAAYADYSVPALPDRVSAGGLRPGGCNFLCEVTLEP